MNNRIAHCRGCGVMLQTIDVDQAGFIREAHQEKGLCQRCFKITQYSDFQKVDIDNSKLFTMIKNYNPQNNLLTLVVDLTDFVETCLFELAPLLQAYRVIVVVNKIDVILADMRRYDLWEAYLQELFAKHQVVIEQFFFVSAKEMLGVKRLIRYLEQQPLPNIRIIGCANVGKSSLIQALFKDAKIETAILPTIFMTPGTTLEELQIPWQQFMIYDTPGIMKPEQLTYYLPNKMIKEIIIQKPIRPKNFHIYEPQTFYIGGYAQVNILPQDTNSITFFMNNNVTIHRKKYVVDEQFYQKHVGTLLVPPYKDGYQKITALADKQTHQLDITRSKTDVVISGLGWFSIHHKNTMVDIITVKGIKVYTQNSII